MALRSKLHLALLQLERAPRPQIHASTESVHLLVRRRDLRHLDRAERIRRNDIERQRAIAAVRRGYTDAVELHRIQIGLDAAHHDEAPLALVAVERDARDALDRLRRILIGETTDVIRRHEIGQRISRPLLVDRARRADR